MGTLGLGLSYWLPRTEFIVEVTRRTVVETDVGGSRLATVADAQVTSAVVEDPTGRHSLWIEAGLLEKISLVVNLDDRGFIQSVNSESGRDLGPALSVIGKAVTLATAILLTFALRPPSRDVPTLEDRWADLHPELHKLSLSLTDRVAALAARLVQEEIPPAEVVSTGAALETLQSQLALISQAKRLWIAGQASDEKSRSWRLGPADLVQVGANLLPGILRKPEIPPMLVDMADEFGVLVAIADPTRGDRPRSAGTDLVDAIALRRSRPVQLGVYLRDERGRWSLDTKSARHLDVVDGFSPVDYLSVDGSWWKTKKFELSYHPDMSLKSFGVTASSNGSSVAASVGDVLDALGQARKDLAGRPSAASKELAAAQTQLDLLKTANEFEVLAATRERAAELAALEQQKKLREAGS